MPRAALDCPWIRKLILSFVSTRKFNHDLSLWQKKILKNLYTSFIGKCYTQQKVRWTTVYNLLMKYSLQRCSNTDTSVIEMYTVVKLTSYTLNKCYIYTICFNTFYSITLFETVHSAASVLCSTVPALRACLGTAAGIYLFIGLLIYLVFLFVSGVLQPITVTVHSA